MYHFGKFITSFRFEYLNKAGNNPPIKIARIWIITDYFRIRENTINRSGHMLKDFISQTDKDNWKIIDQQDITLNILPTLRFVYMYVERFFQPLSEFAKDKVVTQLVHLEIAVRVHEVDRVFRFQRAVH